MLSTPPSTPLQQSQVALSADLIRRLCREDRHQHALTVAGVLDTLATRVASFALSAGHSVPEARALAETDGLGDVFPEPGCANLQLGLVLDAVSAILGDSKYRACRLVNSPSILAVFSTARFVAPRRFVEPRKILEVAGLGPATHTLTTMEFLLPAVPVPMSRAASSNPSTSPELPSSRTSSRTSLSRFGSSSVLDLTALQSAGQAGGGDSDRVESAFIAWLIHLVRSRPDHDRLMAASILASLFKAGLGTKNLNETSTGMLVIPILVDMLKTAVKTEGGPGESDSLPASIILERAPAILARFVADREYLSKCAFDCGAVVTLARLLKAAYDPVQSSTKSYWSPEPDTTTDAENVSEIWHLGDRGIDPVIAHKIKLRESALKAISALAANKDDYRKAFMAEEIFAYVVESLSETPGKPRQGKERARESDGEAGQPKPSAEYGANPSSVVIAACHVIRVLSRSPAILRTAIVDCAVALPMFGLLKHSDINVQAAATATTINFVTELSPVREVSAGSPLGRLLIADLPQTLIEAGVMTVLCDHAHSDNAALRLNALWALKHLMHTASPDFKKKCLELLGPGWLVQLIRDDGALPNALVNEASEKDMDEDVDMQVTDEPFRWVYWANGSVRELDTSQSTRLRQVEDRLAAVCENELNPVRKALQDDLAIQEQGLDFIRNLIGLGPGSTTESAHDTTEMIDFLFNELGQERLFEVLSSKLRAKVLQPFSRRAAANGRDARILHPQSKIIVAVIFVFVHMAASVPRHRQLIIAHTELLKLLAQQFGNKDREVREGLCHLVANLVDEDGAADVQACSRRAHELKRVGFHAKIEMLMQQDRHINVKVSAEKANSKMERALY